ncbi:YceH family protein [Desulfosediminicola flagellatus]|uniref:YceH family protein n=1 Tax=Desulfosediminicola flagellatus TaxID=2569541 RepID=UPI0010AC2F0A|nr:YceH family protein [Desulfosediminicola flagellatus]
MDILLTDTEARILGCLMEKEMATPDYYPLTLNALTNACNQKSNRNPVVSYDEETVISALDSLREMKLVRQSNVSRAIKYEQIFSDSLKLINREQAILCVLLLRGPQTVGEIRGRTERLFSFQDLDEVKTSITSLEDMELVMMLPKEPGRKESRYAHLMGEVPAETAVDTPSSAVQTIIRPGNATVDRITELEKQVEELREEMHDLQQQFTTFKSQFE